jgi:hypothetical protein
MRDSSAPHLSGNCNGNKLNRRIEILENLLGSSGDDTTAKTNSLRQALARNKSDMAGLLFPFFTFYNDKN